MRVIEPIRHLLPAAIWAGLALAASPAAAQGVPYFATQYGAPYTAVTGGTPVAFGSLDDDATLMPIGFAFTYYGVSYDFLNVNTNGGIVFANSCSTAIDCDFNNCTGGRCQWYLSTSPGTPAMPDSFSPNAIVAPWWDDLHIQGGTVFTQLIGAAPNREFVVEWNNIRHYSGAGGSRANFQVRLYEASGIIRMHYGPYIAAAAENGNWSGTPGIEDHTGTTAILGLTCGGSFPFCPYTELQSLQNQVIEFAGPVGPELTGAPSALTGADPGAMISIPVTVRNIGPMPTGVGFDVQVYFSTDTAITTADTLLGTIPFPALAAQTALTLNLDATIPNVAPGFYSIGAIIDSTNVVAEDVEANNTVLLVAQFLVGADLGVQVGSVPATGPGEIVNVPVTVLNFGSAQSVVPIALYFSRNQTLDAMDTLLGTSTVSVPAAPSTLFNLGVSVPAIIPGNYYTIAVVDPNNIIPEANENNNTASNNTVTELRGADLVASNISYTALFAFRGLPFTVSMTLANDGGAAAVGFYYSLHLSENQLISALTDPMLGEFGPITMDAGEVRTVTHTMTVPANITAGPYYVGGIANTQSNVLEELQNNNITRSRDRIEVRDPAPDFVVTRVRLPAMAAAGESFTAERTIANQGNAPGTAPYAVYLSADATIDPATDLLLGQTSVMLTANQEDFGVDTFPIPAVTPAGAYYVGYVVDPGATVNELFEDNNQLVSGGTVAVLGSQLVILTQQLPIATVNVPYDVYFAAAGGNTGYVWSMTSGSLPAGLTMNAMGRLSGTPTEEGRFQFDIEVRDGALAVVRSYTLLSTLQTTELAILTHALAPAFVDRAYEYPLTVSGGIPPFVWTVTGDSLPDGMVLSPQGVFGGTPRVVDIANLSVRVTDATGAFAERLLVLRVVSSRDSVRFSNDVLPDGRLGDQYDETLRIAPGTGSSPFRWQLSSGALPPGLVMENERIHGVPTQVGVFSFTARVSDLRGDYDLNRFVIEIAENSGVTFVSSGLPFATVGVPYTDELGAAVRLKAVSAEGGGGTIRFMITSGQVAPGLTLGEDGVITGTPSSSGTFSFVVLAVDALAQDDSRAFGIVVMEPPVTPPVVTEPDGCGCASTRGDFGGGGWLWAGLLGVGFVIRRKKLGLAWAVLAAVSLPSVANAQIPYFIDSRTETYVERQGGTPLSLSSQDDGSATVTIPFAFRFYENDYTTAAVGSNGYVTFSGDGSSLGNTALPSTTTPNNLISLFWDDLLTTDVRTFVEGTTPSRVFIIQYVNTVRYPGGNGSGTIKMQLFLYEGLAGRFEIRYGPLAGMTSPSVWNASSGFENATGSVGMAFMPCTPNCTGTDLAGVENMIFRAQQDAGPDIVASAVGVPVEVFQGISFDASVTMSSLHQNPLGPFVYELHLLAANQTEPNNLAFTSGPITLQPYEVLTVPATPAIPLSTPVGRYRLALVVDSANQIAEPNENNNVVISADSFRIAAQQPDFTVVDVVPAMPNVAPGSTMEVTAYLRNAGNLAGTSAWSLVLSRNAVISPDDLEIDSGEVTLPLLTTATVTTTVMVPSSLTPGTYYLGAIMDPANLVAEISEVNNALAGASPLTVASGAVNVATTALPGAYVATDYSFFLQAAGGDGTYEWRIESGALPPGLSLIPNTGEIRGRPTQLGVASFMARVLSGGQSGAATLMLDVASVDAGLTVLTRQLLPGLVGADYPPAPEGTPREMRQHITAAGGSGRLTFTLASDPPPGLTLESDGYLSGVPLQRGVFDVNVVVTDGNETATRTIPLTIGEPGRLTLVAAVLPDGRLETEYLYELSVIGRSRTATVSFTTGGPMPPGITLTPEGRIVGVPQRIGTWVFSVLAQENTGDNAAQDSASFRLTVVADAGFGMTPSSLPVATIGIAYEQRIEARQGRAPFTWRVLGPPLPRGIQFEVTEMNGSQSLRFVGLPEVESIVSVLVTVVDGDGRYAEQAMTLQVVPPPPPPLMTPDPSGCSCSSEKTERGSWLGALALVIGGAVLRRRRR